MPTHLQRLLDDQPSHRDGGDDGYRDGPVVERGASPAEAGHDEKNRSDAESDPEHPFPALPLRELEVRAPRRRQGNRRGAGREIQIGDDAINLLLIDIDPGPPLAGAGRRPDGARRHRGRAGAGTSRGPGRRRLRSLAAGSRTRVAGDCGARPCDARSHDGSGIRGPASATAGWSWRGRPFGRRHPGSTQRTGLPLPAGHP